MQPLITASDISIDSKGEWRFKGEPIKNRSILHYFKKNLYRDNTGYFIKNVYGEKIEKSYIKSISGFPVHVIALEPEIDNSTSDLLFLFFFDSGEKLELNCSDIKIFNDITIAVYLMERNIFARFSRRAMIDLGKYTEQKDDETFIRFNDKKIRILNESLDNFFRDSQPG